jgi:chromodomain-helicase-DNA-binding protein 3
VKVVLFILSLQLDVQRPFLVISTSTALSIWEAEFLHLAPCANVIVYKGNRDVRSSIRSLEFYNEGGGIMFNVLLSSADVVVEVLFFYIHTFKISRQESIFLDDLFCD